jgi:tripeptidyl-peptidase-2
VTLGGHDFGTRKLAAGETAALWIAPPAPKSIPKGASPGDVLLGTVRYGEKGSSAQEAGDRPAGWPLAVRLASKRVEDEPKEADDAPKKKDKTPAELEDELLELKVGHLTKLREDGRDEDFEELSKRLLKEHPRALPVLVERMRWLAEQEDVPTAAVVAACDAVAKTAAASQLAEVLGERAAPEDEAAKATREKAEKRRDALVEALRRKIEALRDDPGADAEVEEAYLNLARWADPAKGDAATAQVEYERRRGRPAKALEVLNGRMKEELPAKPTVKERLRLFETLGWNGWADRERRWLLLRFPESYPPF